MVRIGVPSIRADSFRKSAFTVAVSEAKHPKEQVRAVMSTVEILIVDDHEIFRRTVRSLIESEPHYHVCGEACDGIEAIEKARQLCPDIVLMDINMPHRTAGGD